MQRVTMEAAEALLDMNARIGASTRAHQQLEGAVALYNRLAEQDCAYLADEVGMGKTYVALAVLALMQHYHPRRRVLVIAPRENIQRKWEKDLLNLVRHNVRFPDLRVKALDGRPSMPLLQCHSLTDLVKQTSLHSHGVFFTRMTSFSLSLGEMGGEESAGGKLAKRMRDDLRKHLPWLDAESLDLRTRDSTAFKEAFARCVCCALPCFDLVIVDEAHNLKHGLHTGGSARNRVLATALGNAKETPPKDTYPGYGSRSARVLLLSATPVEESYTQLWNQLQVLGHGDTFPELLEANAKDAARRLLIRRVTALEVDGRRLTKNLYRREWRLGGVVTHDEPMRVTGLRERLVLALAQKKVAEIIGAPRFGTSFQMGMLASFESFQETLVSRSKNTATSAQQFKSNKEDIYAAESMFDGSEQTEEVSARQGVDVRSINALARSYRSLFEEELPHPKMDALRDTLRSCWRSGEKALVFVRRIASVRELKLKLEETYDEWLLEKLRIEFDALPAVVTRMEEIFKKYRKEHRELTEASRGQLDTMTGSSTRQIEDQSSAHTFFSWFYRGEGPRGVLSGASLQRRLRQGTFFEDNHVCALLGCKASQTLASLAKMLGDDVDTLSWKLTQEARMRLSSSAKKIPRKMVFAALQATALHHLSQSSSPQAIMARVILHERYADMRVRENSRAPEIPSEMRAC